MEKGKFDNYIDGVVTIYEEKCRKSDFSAKANPKSKDDLKKIVKLNYQELSKRNKDFEFAEQSGFTLTMKIKTRKISGITSKHMAVINNFLYSIKHIDSDRKNLFLYMEGVRSIAQ